MADQEFTVTIRASDDGVFTLLDNTGKKLGELDTKLGKTTGLFKEMEQSFKKGLAEGLKATGDGLDNASKKAGNAESAFSRLGATVIALNQTWDLASRAMSLAERAAGAVINEIERVDKIQDLAEALNMTTREVTAWQSAVKMAGADSGALNEAFIQLSRNIEFARAGLARQEDAFAALNIKLRDGQGQIKSVQKIFLELADASVKYGTSANAWIGRLIGGGAGAGGLTALLPVLQEGSAGIRSLMGEAQQLGGVVSDSVGRTGDALDKQLGRMSVAWQGVKDQFFAGLGPAVEYVLQKLIDAAKNANISGGSIENFGKRAGQALKDAADWVEKFLDKTKNMTIPDAFAELWKTTLEPKLKDAATYLGATFAHALMQGVVDTVKSNSSIFGAALGGALIGALLAGPWGALFGAMIGGSLGKASDEAAARYAQQAPQQQTPQGGLMSAHGATGTIEENTNALRQQASAAQNVAKAFNLADFSVEKVVGNMAYLTNKTTGARTELEVIHTQVDRGGKLWDVYKDKLGNVVSQTEHFATSANAGAGAALQSLNDEIAKMEAAAGPFHLAAQGQISWAEAVRQSDAILKTFNTKLDANTLAMAEQRAEAARSYIEVGKQNRAIEEQVGGLEASIEAFDKAIAQGKDINEATRLGSEAAEDYARAKRNEAVAGSDVVRVQDAEIAKLRELQREQEHQAQNQATKNQIELLQYTIQLEDQQLKGLISEYDVRVLLAQKTAEQQGLNVQLAGQLEKQRIALEDFRLSVTHLGPAFRDTLKQMGADVIQGQWQGLGTYLENLGKTWGEKLWSDMIDSKLRWFDPQVKNNFLDLASTGSDIFGGIFKGIGQLLTGDFSGAGNSILNIFGGSGGNGFLGSLLGGSGGGLLSGLLGGILAGGGASSLFGGGLSLALSSASLANTGIAALTGVNALQNLFGTGGSLLQGMTKIFSPSTLNTIFDGVAKTFGESAAGTFAQWLGNTGVFNAIGGVTSAIGGGYSAFSLGQGNISAANIMSMISSIAYLAYSFGPYGAIIGAIIQIIGALIGIFAKFEPTKGTLARRAAESMLDSVKTFADLQKTLGDITRDTGNYKKGSGGVFDNYKTGAQTAIERGMPQAGLTGIQGFASVFSSIGFAKSQIWKDSAIAQVLQSVQQYNILAEFFSRAAEKMGLSGDKLVQFTLQQLRQAFKEMGIDLPKAIASINSLSGAINHLNATGQVGVQPSIGESIRGVAKIFEQDYPAGVHIAEIALESMTKNGVSVFKNLTAAQKESLFQLQANTDAWDKLVNSLAAGGAVFDEKVMARRVVAIGESVKQITDTMGNLFTAPTVEQGIDAMMSSLKQKMQETFATTLQNQLLTKTNIGASFEQAFTLLDQINSFDLTKAGGIQEFEIEMQAALQAGDDALHAYIPTIERIRQAIKDAFTPKTIEDFLAQVPQIEDNLRQAIGTGFTEALKAGDKDAAIKAFGTSLESNVKQSIVKAVIDGFANGAILNSALAPLMAKLQYAVSQAMLDGVVNAGEQAVLKLIIDQIGTQTRALINSLGPLIGELFDLVGNGIDEQKDRIKAITAGIRSDFGSAAKAFADQIAEAMKPGSDVAGGFSAAWDAFVASAYESLRNAIITAIVDAFMQGAVIEGALGPLLDVMKQDLAEAFKDGILTAQEKAKIQADIAGVGTAFGRALEFLKPLLGDLYDVIVQATGMTEPPTSKKGGDVTAHGGDIVRTKTPSPRDASYDEYRKLSDQQRELFTATMDTWNLSIEDSIRVVKAWSSTVEKQGVKFNTAFDALKASALLQGKDLTEVTHSFMQNLLALGDFSRLTVQNMGQMSVAGQAFAHVIAQQMGTHITDKMVQESALFEATLKKYNIGLGDALSDVHKIMQEKGLSFADAIDYWITWVLSGGKAAEDQAKLSDDATKAKKDQIDADRKTTDDYKNFLTGQIQDPALKEAARAQMDDYITMLRRQGLSEEEIRQKMAEEWFKAGGSAAQFIKDTANLIDAMKEPANAAAGQLGGVAETAANAAQGLGSVATKATEAADALGKIGSQGGGGTQTPAPEPAPAAAMGGSFARSAIVGEAGLPELVVARRGGGFDVIPLTRAQAQALMAGGVSGFAGGTGPWISDPGGHGPYSDADPHPRPPYNGDTNPNPRGPVGPEQRNPRGPHNMPGYGWNGDPRIGPDDLRNPANAPLSDAAKAAIADIQKNVQEALADGLANGFEKGKSFSEEFAKSLRTKVYDALAKTLEEAITNSAGMAAIERKIQKLMTAAESKMSGKGGITLDDLKTAADQIDEQIVAAEQEAKKYEALFDELQKRAKDRALAKPIDVKINVDFSDLIKQALGGMKTDDLSKAVKQQIYDGTIEGLVQGLLASGPLAKATSKLQDKLSDAISDALQDGKIDKAEQRRIAKIAKHYGSSIQDLLETLGPVGEQIAKALGIDLKKSSTTAGDALKEAITTAFTTDNGVANFAKNAKQALFVNVRDAMIQAFIDQVVVAGALGPILDRIKTAFQNIGKDGFTMADAVKVSIDAAKEAGALIPGIQDAMKGWDVAIGDMAKAFDTNRYAVDETVKATDSLADTTQNIADATINYQKAAASLGLVALNQVGREGGLTIESFIPLGADGKPVPKLAGGGLVTRPTLGIIGEAGPEIVIPLGKLSNGGKTEASTNDLIDQLKGIRKVLEGLRKDGATPPVLNVGLQNFGRLERKARRIARKAGQRTD